MARDRAATTNKPRGVPRVDDPRVLNDISWVLRSSAPWRDLPERYGSRPNHSIQQAVDLHECRKRAVIERVCSPSLFTSL
jgi:transposase